MIPESEVPADVLIAAREALASQFERSVGAFPYHPKRIRGGLLDGTYEIRAICRAIMADRASRLPRQDDEIRKAALEDLEAAEKRFALIAPQAHNRAYLDANNKALKRLRSAIRALSQKGDEADG